MSVHALPPRNTPAPRLQALLLRMQTQAGAIAGVLVCNRAGMRLASNAAADRMAQLGWWQCRGETAGFASAVTQAAWLQALRAGAQLPVVMPVYDPLAALVALARINPVQEDAGLLVLVMQPLRPAPCEACVPRLRRLFDLTPSEASLVMALHRQGDLSLAAAELGIGLEGARTRMKSIYAKSDLRGQAELMRVVDALATLCELR